jgi:hypothetical protein
MGKTGAALTGESPTGATASPTSTPGVTAKTGEAKTGEVPTGDALAGADTLAAPVQALTLDTPTPTIAGAGAATATAAVQTLTLDTPAATIERRNTLSAPVQTLTLDTPTPTITGAGAATATAAVQTLTLATPDARIGFAQWLIGGQSYRVVGVTLTPTELSLDIRARTQAERAGLDTLDDNAGAVNTRERADGTVDGLDTSGGGNTFEVIPPVRHQPERVTRDWHVDDVSRERTSASTQATRATVALINAATRASVTGYADGADSTAWTFEFAGGTIVTPRVSEIRQQATTALRLVLEPAQAELFETVTAATAGAVTTTVPDGETFARDTTPGDRQTVTITPPSGASDPAIPQGDYVVTGWESEGADGGAYRVRMDIATRYE